MSDCGVGVVARKVCTSVGTFGDISVSRYAGLRQTIITVSFLPFMSRMKRLHFHLRILKGPVHGGTNGSLTVTARIHIRVQVGYKYKLYKFGLYIRLSSYYECTCLQYFSDLLP